MRLSGGRTWRAHFKFTSINIELIFLRKKIEDVREAGAPRQPKHRASGAGSDAFPTGRVTPFADAGGRAPELARAPR
jgi:hypothetical protein